MPRLRSPPPPPPPLMVNRANRRCSLLEVLPSSAGSQMLRQAKEEVPSLELGPPSPSWMDQIVGSPPGDLKPATRHESSSARFETTWIQVLTPEQVVSRSVRVQESTQTRHSPVVARKTSSASRATSSASRTTSSASRTTSSASRSTFSVREAGTASCDSRKRSTSPSCQSPSKRSAKKRRAVPSGETTKTTELEKWSTVLTADALSETFLAPSTMDMERDATEQFMNDFWGDLALDTSPVSNDNLVAAASPFDELHTPTPAVQPDCRLLDDVTEDQLLELAQFLEPGLPETAALAFDDLLPPPAIPAPAEVSVAAPIDLAALLEETEIVFSPELALAEEPTVTQPASLLPTPACTLPPAPAAPAAPAAPTAPVIASASAEPMHYVLVLSAPEHEPAAPEHEPAAPNHEPAAPVALSVTSDSIDDPEFELDDATTSEAEAEAEAEAEVAATTAPTRKRSARRSPAATPAEKYRRIRDTNNEASRRSRQQRKLRDVDTQARATELEEENGRLRQKVDVLEGLLEQVKALAPLLTAKR